LSLGVSQHNVLSRKQTFALVQFQRGVVGKAIIEDFAEVVGDVFFSLCSVVEAVLEHLILAIKYDVDKALSSKEEDGQGWRNVMSDGWALPDMQIEKIAKDSINFWSLCHE
jgi:hypothetical protein